MNRRVLFFTVFLAALAAYAQVRPIAANIDAAQTGAPITKYIYGQFIEHIAGIINNGLWAEMLEDRKFYSPVTARPPAVPAQGRRGPLRRWMPIGPEEFVVMDRDLPYAGIHAPLVKLNGAEARGLQQNGLAVRKGMTYTGRVVLAGDSGAKVTVNLVWGTDANQRQSVAVSKLGATYRTFPLKFQAQADSDEARLEIAGSGTGAFHVGAVSLMPADNMQGFRAEVIAVLKTLRSGVYRFPGGNFVSAHEWRHAIGDPDSVLQPWIRSGTPFSRTTSAPMNS